MKVSCLFSLIIALFMFAGCAAAPNPTKGSKIVRDIEVQSAVFGSGANVADVTDRVVELLRSEPKGFTPRADWLRVDPLPYKRKSLAISYKYRGEPHLLVTSNQEKVSYDLLLKNAKK